MSIPLPNFDKQAKTPVRKELSSFLRVPSLKTTTKIALLNIIKGIIGAKTTGRAPKDKAAKLGNIQSIKAYSIGSKTAPKKSIALTIGPVMG